MKRLKKLICVLVCAFLSTSVIASQPELYRFEYEDLGITVVFEKTSPISNCERQEIADKLVYGNQTSKGISLCWLLGHDYQYDAVSVIEHKVFQKAPRCRRTTYEVVTCSKCDYMDTSVLNVSYLYCCPED